ncbi:MAG: hypothetical protein COV52_06100 [Gammaproteobacteria bacterium CG11_big_fil_rev_8_21_14_0_20_46_22]|nr:MAG: hypothetical protein COW05_07560 [Gammaproteobacteria bacterium CG12_big_fil_rev_8_21_14_0_65_46_12]PIR11074.1 MAG: hypothetical protein COV52_06100 [Gammaproteobacteria bacterium CG11_big_fil_rev_8_21_14_0_20_46_22]
MNTISSIQQVANPGMTCLIDWRAVASPYYLGGDIVGPQRMAYDPGISLVDVAAKLLTTVLKE